MALSQTASVTLAAASVNNICLLQSAAGAANLTLNGSTVSGGVATLDVQRRVLVTSAANDSGITFTITGKNKYGNAISEVLTGGNVGTAQSIFDYLTVSRIATSGATAGNVTVGTSSVGSSQWLMLSPTLTPFNIAMGVVATGTVNYTVEYTYENPNNTSGTIPTVWSHPTLVTLTATQDGSLTTPVHAVRLTVNSGTGTAAMRLIQAGVTN